jgi:hypothetical protein
MKMTATKMMKTVAKKKKKEKNRVLRRSTIRGSARINRHGVKKAQMPNQSAHP